MNEIKISLDTVGEENGITLVRVDGVIDTMTATELEKVINSLLEQKRFNIIIDLGGVDYISSAGWGIFISNIRELRQQGGDLKLVRMIPNVYEIFELLEFNNILRAFDDIEEAKEDFRVPVKQMITSGSRKSQNGPERDRQSPTSTHTASAVSVKNQASPPSASPASLTVEMDFDEKMKDIIKKDPFLTINDIKRELRSDNYREASVGWWGIWRWLYSHKLTSRKERYHFSRK